MSGLRHLLKLLGVMLLEKIGFRFRLAVDHGLTIRSSLLVTLALAALSVMSVMSSTNVLSWGTASAQISRPAIHSVHPEPPHCVLHDSPYESDRLLTLTGENLTAAGGSGRVEFLEVATGAITDPIAQDVDWLDPRRITVDMALVQQSFRPESRIRLRVRIVSAETSGLASKWSDEFILAHDESSCGLPRPFPSTSPIRGIAGDFWADIILGKPDFTQIAPKSVVPFKVNNPTGVVVDRSVDPGRAYVWDSGNSRILGIDLGVCYEGATPCSADIIIGQPSGYDHAACNGDNGVQNFPMRARPTAETLCGIPDHSLSPWEGYSFVTMAVDGDGNLYVPDSYNHRVLKYNSPFESDSIADKVWGQTDFSGMVCNRGDLDNPTAESLCFHSDSIRFTLNRHGAGVEIDSGGNMWVADTGNNRVLRFPAHPSTGEIAESADLVLGQTDFITAEPGSSPTKLHAPSAIRFDSLGLLYVADAANDRVLVFEPPFVSGAPAAKTYGSQLHHPSSLEVDPFGRGVWVVDSGNYMVELWDTTGTNVLQVLGKDSYQPNRECGPPMTGVPGGSHLCPFGGGVGLDSRGNLLVPVYHGAADVFRFATLAAQIDGTQSRNPDRRFFFPPLEDNFRDRKGIHSARGVATWQDQFIVSDIKRLMFWNGLDKLVNGQPSDGVVGDEFAVEGWPYCCGRIKVDAAGRLWVLGFEGRHFLDVYQLPLTESSVPIHTIWKESASFPVLGTVERTALGGGVVGLAPEGSGESLWISDTDNHRVLRIRDPLTDPVVDVILGQEDAAGGQCNRGRFPAGEPSEIQSGENLDLLCFPGALSVDRAGNLYVSDHALEINGNRRLLVFSAESTPSTNSEAIFAPLATKVFTRSAVGRDNLWVDPWVPGAVIRENGRSPYDSLSAATWEPAFDSTNRMVVGYNAYEGPRFVGIYDDPLGQQEHPTSFLHDFGSMPYTATFDENDNLYVGDINRARVLVYRNPFNNKPEPAEQQTIEAPVPEYPVTFQSVDPEPPSCIIRNSPRTDARTLSLMVEGMADRRDLALQFRKVTSRHREFLDIGPELISNNGTRITISENGIWRRLWGHLDRVVITVRILERGHPGTPVSNWSPAFVLAENAATCGNEVNLALGPPTIGTVTPNSGFLTVSWNAPEERGTADIVSYDLRHVPTADDGTVDSNWTLVEKVWSASDGGELENDVIGLAVGTRFDVQVRAIDATGPGPWSVTFTGTPKTPSVCFTGGAVAVVTNTGLVSDCEALLASRDTLAGTAALNWSSYTPIAQWHGITIGGTPARVAGLNIRGEGLGGSVPAELGRLSGLTYLNLRDNGLAGPIPSTLGNLTNLLYLGLNNNRLSGPIPDLRDLTNLEDLYLSNNNLSGGLPDWLGSLTEVKELWLWGNVLEGPIPDLSGMVSLDRLKLQNNRFTGGVPKWFGEMNHLRYLYLHNNPLGGSIPSELGGMTNLRYLWIHSNELVGSIPAELGQLSNLLDLNLHSNKLTGAIPAELQDMDSLLRLRLHRNMLTGGIPSQLGNLEDLRFMWLHGNKLGGSIPASLGSLASLERLWLSENRLSGPIPAELDGLSSLVQWRFADNRLTGCVPAGLSSVVDTDFNTLGLPSCSD